MAASKRLKREFGSDMPVTIPKRYINEKKDRAIEPAAGSVLAHCRWRRFGRGGPPGKKKKKKPPQKRNALPSPGSPKMRIHHPGWPRPIDDYKAAVGCHRRQ